MIILTPSFIHSFIRKHNFVINSVLLTQLELFTDCHETSVNVRITEGQTNKKAGDDGARNIAKV